MARLISVQGRHTNPVVWIAAIVCAIVAIVVIIAGIIAFVIYMIYHPRVPYISIVSAHLNRLDYDQFGTLNTELAITVVAENNNRKADADFSEMGFVLRFNDMDIARLRAGMLHVPKNSSLPLDYLVESTPIPLDAGSMSVMDSALKNMVVPFDLIGEARTRWRLGFFLSIKFLTHLSCPLKFFWPNGSAVDLDCRSKSN